MVEKDLKRNVLVVSQGEDSPRLYSRYTRVSQLTWVAGDAPAKDGVAFRATAKYRYRQQDQPVTAMIRGEEMFVTSDELQRAVTPGQSVVLYQGDVCLGGGIAEECSMQPFA